MKKEKAALNDFTLPFLIVEKEQLGSNSEGVDTEFQIHSFRRVVTVEWSGEIWDLV